MCLRWLNLSRALSNYSHRRPPAQSFRSLGWPNDRPPSSLQPASFQRRCFLGWPRPFISCGIASDPRNVRRWWIRMHLFGFNGIIWEIDRSSGTIRIDAALGRWCVILSEFTVACLKLSYLWSFSLQLVATSLAYQLLRYETILKENFWCKLTAQQWRNAWWKTR
jgi:hypothetical protein